MTQPINTLMNEHRLIEKVLSSLDRYTADVAAGTAGDRPTIARYAEFFREFADRCHHGKEENILFKALARNGMPTGSGPIAVMLHEHNIGRALVTQLASMGQGSAPLTGEERKKVRQTASNFVSLLGAHIRKEDAILFRIAEQQLPRHAMDDVAARFDAFEQREMGEGVHERLHSLAESLIGSEAHAAGR